jgi:GxxExxY protein
MVENQISNLIIGSALKIHTALGPGLLESAYEICLSYDLVKAGLRVERQKTLPIVFQDVKLDAGYRLDLLVENKVIVEIKAIETFNDVHLAQLLTYLKLSGCKLGLLINFNVRSLKDGVRRVVNHL